MVTQATYKIVSLEDPNHQWELFNGRLVEKPTMSFAHNDVMSELGYMLRSQLPRDKYRVRVNAGRLRYGDRSYFVPDVMVIDQPVIQPEPSDLETYKSPLPLVVEIWSPSTGLYDIDEKIPEYLKRGDLEVWRLHPYERTLTAWRRREDGGYDESIQRGGVVHPVGLPNVTIDLDELFNLR